MSPYSSSSKLDLCKKWSLAPARGVLLAGLKAEFSCRNPSVVSNLTVVGPYKSYHTWEEQTPVVEEYMCKVGQFKLECSHITCWQLLEMPALSPPAQRLNSFLSSSELFHHSLSITGRRASHKHGLVSADHTVKAMSVIKSLNIPFSVTPHSFICIFTIHGILWPCLNFSMSYCKACRDIENNVLTFSNSARKSSHDLLLFKNSFILKVI